MVFRKIPYIIPTFEELNLPNELLQVMEEKMGLIVVSGPTGSGKSTTVASMLNYKINKTDGIIYTLEDPIEFILRSNPKTSSLVTQREVGRDVLSWDQGIISALRSNPTVIFIGEMRTPSVIKMVPVAAETGHLVLTTLHAKSAAEIVSRMIEVLTDEDKSQVAFVLSQTLKLVIFQILVPKIGGGLVPALEWYWNSPKFQTLITQAPFKSVANEILSTMETTPNLGNMTMEKYLLGMVKKGLITKETALAFALRKESMKSYLKGE